MSQSGYACSIEDLPDVTFFTNLKITKDIYCLGLFINIAATGPCRLYVTDFTTNPRVSNPFFESYYIEEFEIPPEQIFQIDVYQEKLQVLINDYERRYNEPLFEQDARPPFRISDKMCILRATVVLKKFNNVLEGRAKSIRLINKEELLDNENLQTLYANICKLPKEYLKENLTRARNVIPDRHLGPILPSFERRSPRINEHNEVNVKVDTESVIHDSQPRETYVKTEEATENMIPDTLFPNDYSNTAQQSLDADTFQQEDEAEPENANSNHATYLQQPHSQKAYYSLKQLNDYHSYGIDNEVYRVKGKILGCNPSDWSQICIKKYEHEAEKNKIVLSDPYIRSMEIILCDQIPLNGQEEILLDSDNSITIVLDQAQVSQALNIEAIELAYTKIPDLNKKSFTNEVVEFELYKKLVNINTNNQFLIWTARNISFDAIMK